MHSPATTALDVDCVAVDFETANAARDSACALAVTVISQSQVAEEREWSFRPRCGQFNPRNVRLHGITANSVAASPEFCDLWHEILPYFDGRLLIARYAHFDISVLRHTLDAYSIPYPTFDYHCTWLLAKATWPTYATHRLDYLAQRFGLDTDHHNPSSDARVCSRILLRACEAWGARSLPDLESRAQVSGGHLSEIKHSPPSRLIPDQGGRSS